MNLEKRLLRKNRFFNSIPQIGDVLPNFNLLNPFGKKRTLNEIIKNGPVIVTFYRGGWCPYCNLELRAYQQKLDEINNLGTTLIAITPETPDSSLSTSEKLKLKFEVLSDINSEYIKSVGLSFNLAESLQVIYKKSGMDVEAHNGNKDFYLPVPATYVLDKSGTIRYLFADVDYTKRADPEEVLKVVKQLVD